ncbi:hypothetical protein PKOR_17435 [Pontibacter korlensis]|uniref:Putative beta-lactamase-inhibitor-like PepSY-like domain-containing protein n=1 Tax=Pontibacter korlensis TaxID=400092 RepID=A0A0E3ZJ69_9BACT|nr:hypothetical protein PKOR_17435 [Pontibacter korlensis]
MALSTTACDSFQESVDVPEVVQTQFDNLYPAVDKLKWDENPGGYQAAFELSGRSRTAHFDAQGKLLKIDEEIESQGLPEEALALMQRQYDKYELEEARRVQTGEQTTYVVELDYQKDKLELTFNEKGQLLKQEEIENSKVSAQFASIADSFGAATLNENAFAKPVTKWELPSRLKEVSGIAFLPDGRMACVQDEQGTIFIFNLDSKKIEGQVRFGSPGDYEGIAVDGKKAYILRSDGTVFEVADLTTNEPQVKKYASVLAGSQNTEGLALDKENNRLLIACKGYDKRLGQNKGIYAIDLASGKMNPKPVVTIPMDQEVLKKSAGKKKKGYDLLQPSSLEVHPQTGDYYLLDAVNQKIMVVEKNGKISRAATLDKDLLRQPEGLAITQNGELYIASEGNKNSSGVILKYEGGL